MEFKELMSFFADSMIEKHLQEYRKNDRKIQEIIQEGSELQKQLWMLIDTLDSDNKTVIVNYCDNRNTEEAFNYNYIYCAAMKDTIKLLQELGLVSGHLA